HDLPRSHAPAGIQHGAEERRDRAVRQLQSVPVLRARSRGVACARRSRSTRAVTAPALIAYIDGGARGNPGPAGFGVRIEQSDGTLIEEFSQAIGHATNNVAEYRGLLAALDWAKAHGCRKLHVRSDSLLLVQQMLGNYKVKNTGLQPLHAKARLLAHEI